jgi:hypothetical protein
VTIQVGNDSRSLEEVDESWISQQITNRQREGLAICVQVTIATEALNLRLSTPACGSGPGGGRPPRRDEAEIIELWNSLRLGSDHLSGGNLVAFIKRLRHLM